LISAPPGVYTLNVIADNGNGKTAYETILIVLAPNQKPIQQSEITKIVQKFELIVEIDFSEDKCSNKTGSANMGFPYQTVSECEVEQRDECERTGDDSSYCEGKRERFRDDCEGFKTKEECDKYWETPPGDICLTSFGPPPMCNPEPEPPACDENTPPNTLCRDEGDPDTCEDGFVDRGSGCVREEEDDGEDAEDSVPPSDEGEGDEFFDGGGSEDLEEGGNEDQEASSDEGDSQFG
jgi:hypothetical protein